MKRSLDEFNELLKQPVGRFVTLDWGKALYLILIFSALATRLWGLGIRVQSHDESLHTKYSWNLYTGRGFQHSPLMHGPFLFHATALSYFLFGDNDFTARLAVALIGAAVVIFPYLLRRWLGRAGALTTSFFLLISPSIAYYSRYIRHDVPVILWSLTVILATFSYLHDRLDRWLYLMAAGVSLMFATKEVAFIYNTILGIFLIGLFTQQALAHDWQDREHLKSLLGIALALLAIGLLITSCGLLPRNGTNGDTQVSVPWWTTGSAVLAGAGLGAAAVILLIGTWKNLHTYPSFDLIILLGTLCIPFLSPLPIKLLGLDPVDYTSPMIYYSGGITIAMLAISVGIGLAWDWRRWSIAAAIHYAIFVVLFTTVFTNGGGIASGFVGSMGYWLKQQGVQRGGQPWYYYGVMVPLYEYLPLLLTIVTSIYLAVRRAIASCSPEPRSFPSNLESSFVPFLLWWTAFSWVIYSYAGEKMPWLTVHLALPMILLGGWAVGRLVESVAWRDVLRRRLWIAALLAPPFVMACATLISAISSGPFQGSSLAQLTTTGQFLGSLISALAFGAGLVYLVRQSGWRWGSFAHVLLIVSLVVLVLLTMRHAWRFCYINYGYPIEHLVYAHASPAVKETMRQIEKLSRRVAGGSKQIKVAYGADGSWPFHWYLRDYPNSVFYGEKPSRKQMEAPVVIAGREQWDTVAPYMANDYIANTYTYLWWPMEDYKGLSWSRVKSALANPKMRATLWNIWYDRDYRLYDEITDKTHTLDEWPLRSQYRLYIRRDVASKIWDLGTSKPEELEKLDPYAKGHRELTARKTFGTQGSDEGQLQSPRGIAVGPEGFVYVADAGNHRIQKFTAEGKFVAAWGRRSIAQEETGKPQGFNEPWDVAVASDGTVYVADTWNHRIQKLDSDGNPITAWGLFGEFGPDDGTSGQSAFYGPRGIAVGPGGNIYVTDTGNKRVQVFEPDGAFISQWGGGGMAKGNLDEPVGIDFGQDPSTELEQDNEVYIADTWNQRVQGFSSSGTFLRQWPIEGWDTGISEEKPYLAADDRGHVYVTDPGHYRVLVFDNQGNYRLSFGQYGTDKRSFALPIGIATAEDGSIYITDSHEHRVLIFNPLDPSSQQGYNYK